MLQFDLSLGYLGESKISSDPDLPIRLIESYLESQIGVPADN
jgi:hypothetical protein